MNSSSPLARPAKRLIAAFALVALASVAIGWTAGTVVASGSRSASPTAPEGAPAAFVPAGGNTNTSLQLGAPTTAGSTSAGIAYPVPGYNQLGVAPEGTILAQGTATADVKADGSDKAAALKKATDAALADAHTQAAAVATSMGVQLGAIYSVSTQTSSNYIYPTPACLVPPLTPNAGGGTSSDGAGAAPASSAAVCYPSTLTTPTSSQLVVTLVVAYKFV
jgi:hypothetical protein